MIGVRVGSPDVNVSPVNSCMISERMAKSFITFHVPEDRELLAALGEIALRHEHLNHILKMTIKSLADVTPQEAISATRYEGSRQLRERVRKLARSRLGEGPGLIRLQALVSDCEQVTEARNRLVHGLWAKELDGDPQLRDAFGEFGPVPTVDELRALATDIESVTRKLNDARLFGFLAEALAAKPL